MHGLGIYQYQQALHDSFIYDIEIFLNESNRLQMVFLNKNYPNHLCKPMDQHIKAGGGEEIFNRSNQYNNIKHLIIRDGSKVV